jgi:hypothetical protein
MKRGNVGDLKADGNRALEIYSVNLAGCVNGDE